MFRRASVLAAIVVLVLTFSGCGPSLVVTSEEEYPLNAMVSVIDLNGYNGGIRWYPIEPGEQPRITITKEVRGSDEQAMQQFLDEILLEDDSTEFEVVLRAVQPKLMKGVNGSAVRFDVYAPPERITHFFAYTHNGLIEVKADFRGYLGLNTSNGRIVLWSGQGEVDAKTSNGAIELGRVVLTGSSTFTTSNGRIEGVVILPPTGRFIFETSNGYIRLRMPSDTSGTFYLYTSNGRINYYLDSEGITQENYLHVTRGAQPVVDIRTSNGSIEIVPDR